MCACVRVFVWVVWLCVSVCVRAYIYIQGCHDNMPWYIGIRVPENCHRVYIFVSLENTNIFLLLLTLIVQYAKQYV